MRQNKAMAIKARVYNKIRTALYKKRLEDISDKEKLEYFEQFFLLNREAHQELNRIKRKRKYRAQIHKARVERGYKFRKKTSLKEYQGKL